MFVQTLFFKVDLLNLHGLLSLDIPLLYTDFSSVHFLAILNMVFKRMTWQKLGYEFIVVTVKKSSSICSVDFNPPTPNSVKYQNSRTILNFIL